MTMRLPLRLLRLSIWMGACVLASGASAQLATWANPGSGSWLDTLNWNPAVVPGSGSQVVISNGGSATLSGIAQTPLLNVLNVGVSNFGNGSGSLLSNGTAVRSSGAFFVGYVTGAGNTAANGRLEINGADGQASSAFVGNLVNATVAGQATGVLQVDGALPLGGSLFAGTNFGSLAGSSAEGRVRIGGNAGQVNSLLVGETFLSNTAQVGSSNQGAVHIGGNLALGSGAFFNIGNSGFFDRVADPLAPGGFRVNQSSGKLDVVGTLALNGAAAFTNIGTSSGGVADATVTLGTLDTSGGRFAQINIGNSQVMGQARGSFAAASGDLRSTQDIFIGTTAGGSAEGSLLLSAGSLLGANNNATLTVGVATGNNLPTANARGSVNAAGGVAGFAAYNVGNVLTRGTAGTRAEGSVVGGSGAGATAATSVTVGSIQGSGENLVAQGSLLMGNALLLQNAFVSVGDNGSASRGSRASGELRIGGDAGTSIGMVVSNVGNFVDLNRVGSSAAGVVRIDGNLALANSAFVFAGNTSGFDRVADPAALGGVRVNQAQGSFEVGGVLTVGSNNLVYVGTTTGGVAEGSFSAGALAMGANRFNVLSIGNSSDGQARGQMQVGSGDVRVSGGLLVGTTAGGQADGTLSLLNGQLQGNNAGALSVGVANPAPGLGQARGELLAATGVNGFSSYLVGVVNGNVGAGTTARGRLMAGDSGGASDVAGINVGSIFNAGAQAQAQGSVEVGNSLRVQSGGVLSVAHNFNTAPGSNAEGALRIRGDAGTPFFTIVGEVFNGGAATQAGSRSSGALQADGALTVAPNATFSVGNTLGADRVADASAPGGVRINEARGNASVGALTLGNNAGLSIGTTRDGSADGNLKLGRVDMAAGGAATLNYLPIGVANGIGTAQGRLEVGGGLLRTDVLLLGGSLTPAGRATGTLVLSNATLEAGQLYAGTGAGGQAQMQLIDARARVAQTLLLAHGLLALERSLVEVGDELSFGDDAQLQIDIDGLTRSAQYGAINARHSTLAGLLEIDFSDLVFSGAAAAFDVLRSDGVNGIDGDFSAYSFVGVPAGYRASAGIELDGAEVYRVRLTRDSTVPEPTSALLAALALALAAATRRPVLAKARLKAPQAPRSPR
jgi:hypothetical protein